MAKVQTLKLRPSSITLVHSGFLKPSWFPCPREPLKVSSRAFYRDFWSLLKVSSRAFYMVFWSFLKVCSGAFYRVFWSLLKVSSGAFYTIFQGLYRVIKSLQGSSKAFLRLRNNQSQQLSKLASAGSKWHKDTKPASSPELSKGSSRASCRLENNQG